MDQGREPDMARYIDSYKFEQNRGEQRNKFGGGTVFTNIFFTHFNKNLYFAGYLSKYFFRIWHGSYLG